MTNISDLKKNFKNKNLFDMALTHRSWVNEHKGLRDNNERLEFLGDAILEFIVSKKIYTKFKEKDEGFLTSLRASLVNTTALSQVAKNLNLGSQIYLSKGEVDGGGRENVSLLADTVEALIGAIFMDSGIDKAEDFINENILQNVDLKATEPLKDPKSRLQEYIQSLKLPTPKYKVISEEGPDHDKKFNIGVEVNGEIIGEGFGKSKAEAEQAGALQALTKKVK